MIQVKDSCGIYFFLDGAKYAYRVWPFVPRNGDEVMLNDPSIGAKRPFIVTRVVWGVEGPDGSDLGRQAVNIEIERAEIIQP